MPVERCSPGKFYRPLVSFRAEYRWHKLLGPPPALVPGGTLSSLKLCDHFKAALESGAYHISWERAENGEIVFCKASLKKHLLSGWGKAHYPIEELTYDLRQQETVSLKLLGDKWTISFSFPQKGLFPSDKEAMGLAEALLNSTKDEIKKAGLYQIFDASVYEELSKCNFEIEHFAEKENETSVYFIAKKGHPGRIACLIYYRTQDKFVLVPVRGKGGGLLHNEVAFMNLAFVFMRGLEDRFDAKKRGDSVLFTRKNPFQVLRASGAVW